MWWRYFIRGKYPVPLPHSIPNYLLLHYSGAGTQGSFRAICNHREFIRKLPLLGSNTKDFRPHKVKSGVSNGTPWHEFFLFTSGNMTFLYEYEKVDSACHAWGRRAAIWGGHHRLPFPLSASLSLKMWWFLSICNLLQDSMGLAWSFRSLFSISPLISISFP